MLLPLVLLLAGCSINRSGVVHHVIIGFGIVSVPATNTVANVTKVRALGAYFGNTPAPQAVIGFVNETTAQIEATATNTVIEVK